MFNMQSHRVLYGILSAIGMFIIFFLIAFQWPRDAFQTKLCFVLEEGDVRTYVVIEDGSPNASITILEQQNGKDIVPPSTGPGTLEKNAVVLVDGTTLAFDDEKLTWPEGSLLAGTVFDAVDCDAYTKN